MKHLLIIALGIFLISCGQQSGQEAGGLTLNNGQKWTVNPETHEGMMNLQTLLEQEPLNLDSIGDQMADETTYIINNCDMKGEAHDQLHLVLHPILDNIRLLKETEDNATKEVGVKAISTSLDQYFEHFETK